MIQASHANPLGLPAGSIVGTSSLRRAAQTLGHNPEIEIRALRGNVPTRIQKLRDGEYDAILLAAAGVGRLELDLGDLDTLELAPEIMLPAPGQGALAIECRAEDEKAAILEKLHDNRVARCVGAERRLLEMLGGGCHLPLGCLATEEDQGLRLQAILGEIDDDATHARVARVAGVSGDPETAVRVCFNALAIAMPEAAQQ